MCHRLTILFDDQLCLPSVPRREPRPSKHHTAEYQPIPSGDVGFYFADEGRWWGWARRAEGGPAGGGPGGRVAVEERASGGPEPKVPDAPGEEGHRGDGGKEMKMEKSWNSGWAELK
jgi:hypothetical protein